MIRLLSARAVLCLTIAFMVTATPVASHASFFGLFGGHKKDKPEIPSEAADEDEAQAGTPNALDGGDTPVDSDVEGGEAPPAFEISPQGPATGRMPWEKPNFSEQTGALGYSADTFTVPAGFEDRVAFWVSIYSKYTTNQGVMHDSQFLNIVYEPVDFADMRNRHAREKYVKEKSTRLKSAFFGLIN